MPTRMLLAALALRRRHRDSQGHLRRRRAGDLRDRGDALCGPGHPPIGSGAAIRGYIEKGVEEGARMVVGGPEAPEDG